MMEKIKKHQRLLLVILIVICMGIIMIGGVRYIKTLRNNLQDQAVQNVKTVTMQHQQAFDNFISGDRERLHSFAEYFSRRSSDSVAEIEEHLKLFYEVDADYMVVNLDNGYGCSNKMEGAFRLDKDWLDSIYRTLSENSSTDPDTGLFRDNTVFGYYECFTFSDGVPALIQKSYERSKVSETFSLSFYNNQGLAYVVNQRGDILLRSVGMIGDRLYENIFDVLTGNHAQQTDIDVFMEALDAQETGSMTFSGDRGSFIYTYVPVENMDECYLVSVVPLNAITAETDQMLLNSQMALGLLLLVLLICAVLILLIWRVRKDIEAREKEAAYQSQLFEIFAAYLSRNTDDIYMMMDHETEAVEYVSPNVERVLGVKPKDVIDALQASDLSHDPEAARAYYGEVVALEPGQAAKPRSTERINAKTGEHKYFQENAYCAVIQGRKKRLAYISDRTKEWKSQNSMAEALRMARAANDAKSAFLSNVSHDIRTPMNAIIGFLALMQDEADNPEIVMEYTRRIDAASQHLLGLINDVLDMNKIESGSTTLSISEMNLADVISEINAIIRPQARAKDQTFDIFLSNLKYEHLLGDKLRLNQILINLLSNAVKYTQEKGTIQMKVEELPQVVNNYSRIRFTVSDNGLGMSEDYLKVIFDPFTREETEVTHEIQGTGLGMAITKSLVDLMGGTIHVESEPDKGSTFTVEVELRIQEREEDEPKFWNEYSVDRMIVADDDEEVCRNIVRTMSQTGVVTDYCTEGENIIQMMNSAKEAGRPYDLILLDWKMPRLNGLEIARLIRKNYSKKIPILLLTAYDWSEIEQEAMEIGVDHFMSKPFFMSTFKDAIRRVMGSEKKEEGSVFNVIQGMHVLVVDDIEVNRIILVKILETLGAICDIGCNGQEAVEKFEASRPGEYDLIMMDVQMPVMNGYAATRAIRSSEHPSANTVPIIAMTANAFVDDVRDAIESGMDAHIAKPVQVDKLKATIQQVLCSRLEQAEENSKTSLTKGR